MNDAYSELLVKKEQTIKEKAIKVLVIALIVLAAVAGIFITPIALVVAVVLGAAAYFLLPNLDLEFEYLYVNGELDIDRIASRAKRKRVKSPVSYTHLLIKEVASKTNDVAGDGTTTATVLAQACLLYTSGFPHFFPGDSTIDS